MPDCQVHSAVGRRAAPTARLVWRGVPSDPPELVAEVVDYTSRGHVGEVAVRWAGGALAGRVTYVAAAALSLEVAPELAWASPRLPPAYATGSGR